MKNDQYRTQLEDQVKDLIAQYLQIHGEAPAVTIEWGKVAPEPKKLVDLNCMVCGKAFKGEEPKMCCSGRDCGCMGLPIEPVACSNECYDKALNQPTLAAPNVRYKIDFGGHILALLAIRDNKLFIDGCMNGYGDGLSDDQIVITEIE